MKMVQPNPALSDFQIWRIFQKRRIWF